MVEVKAKIRKRSTDSTKTSEKSRKRPKTSTDDTAGPSSSKLQEEVDFPRGGGTSYTAAEYKAIRSEAMKELKDDAIFKVCPCTLH